MEFTSKYKREEIEALLDLVGEESIKTKPKWTGHADVEGLKAIGWTDEDIQYYQENGVNWNEEDDEYHKVSEDNKALYGVLTASNISTYKDRIVYLPKIDTSGVTSMSSKFKNCYTLVALPQLDTQKVTSMISMFQNCYSLSCVPLFNTQKVTSMYDMFSACLSLTTIPLFDTQNVTEMVQMFNGCRCLTYVPLLNMQKVTATSKMFQSCTSLVSSPVLNTYNKNISDCFNSCFSLVSIPEIDVSGTQGTVYITDCYSLISAKLKNLNIPLKIVGSKLLSKDSLLYIINNEASTSAITITLASYAYTRLANDADIVAALANHPNITIAQ